MNIDTSIVVFIVGSVVFMVFAITLVIFLVIHKRKRYEHLLEKQTMENNYRNQLLLSRMEVQEQSFRYFSEEIHDNVGQLLSIVKMELYNIRSSSKEEDIVARANKSTELMGKAITDLRNISHTLNSAFVTNAGLADAVEKDLEYIRSAKGVKCLLNSNGEEYSLGNERELLIFRIIQEAISNAVKHASPTEINVFLDYTPEMLTVTIADNGNGFETDNIQKSGIGLNNMHVRTKLLNGRLTLTSERNAGTIIRLEIMRDAPLAA